MLTTAWCEIYPICKNPPFWGSEHPHQGHLSQKMGQSLSQVTLHTWSRWHLFDRMKRDLWHVPSPATNWTDAAASRAGGIRELAVVLLLWPTELNDSVGSFHQLEKKKFCATPWAQRAGAADKNDKLIKYNNASGHFFATDIAVSTYDIAYA